VQTNPELRVEVQRLRNRYVAITRDRHGEELLRNEFHYAPTPLSYLGPLWLVDPDRLQSKELKKLGGSAKDAMAPTQAAEQGRDLYQYLFGNGKALKRHLTALTETAEAITDAGERAVVRMTLSFSSDAAELRRLPWEYLFDGRRFLCLDGPLMLSRAPSEPPRSEAIRSSSALGGTVQDGLPLRVLFVIAAPTDQIRLDVERELGIIQDALAPLIARQALLMALLPEPSLNVLREAVQMERYHLVHYIGHARYHLPQHQGYLCFEDELGHSALTSGSQLYRFIAPHATDPPAARPALVGERAHRVPSDPDLFVISPGQQEQVGVFDAIQSVAHDLVQRGFPSVLGIPANLAPASANIFYRTFYRGLVIGKTVGTALRDGRRALSAADTSDRVGRGRRDTGQTKLRFDWGVPVLHQRDGIKAFCIPRAPHLLDHPSDDAVDIEIDTRKLATAVLPAHRREIQTLRKALRVGARIVYVLGGHGVGKHAFVSYLLDHLGPKVDACLRIDCRDMITPLSSLSRIADFWREEIEVIDAACPEGVAAAERLLDLYPDPRERAQQAQALVANKRILILFENLDAWFTPLNDDSNGDLESPLMRDILLGLVQAPSRSIFFFTGSRRWQGLSELPMDEQREIRLPLLSARYAIQFINQLPVLRAAADTLRKKKDVYQLVGGHPRGLQYVDRWLAFQHTLTELAETAPQPTTEVWLDTLIARLLDALDPGICQVLRSASILKLPFDAATLAGLTHVTTEYAAPMIKAWRQIGFATTTSEGGKNVERYRLDHALRTYLLRRLSPSELTLLHRQAADHYGAPYYDAARRQVLARTITTWSEERIGWLARDTNGILGLRLRQEMTEEEKARLIEAALAWHYHLTAAGEGQAAAQVAQALIPELNRRGQQALSSELLQQAMSLTPGPAPNQKLDTLTKLRLEERSLPGALHAYEELYRSLDPETEVLQRTYVMLRAGAVHQALGELDDAIQHYETALHIVRRQEDHSATASYARDDVLIAQTPSGTDGAATISATEMMAAEGECLSHLATAYRLAGELSKALVCSQGAKELYETLGNDLEQGAVEHEQGQILKLMGRQESALEHFVSSLRRCRRVGDQQGVADNLLEVGRLFDNLGKTDIAIQVIEDAIERHDYLKRSEHAEILSLLESLYARQCKLAEAITRFRTTKARLK
jgi:tetratricopeptide (TPR) repeat protein